LGLRNCHCPATKACKSKYQNNSSKEISSGCKNCVPQKGGFGRSISTATASERRVSFSFGSTGVLSLTGLSTVS
jgi:hypothetical protein